MVAINIKKKEVVMSNPIGMGQMVASKRQMARMKNPKGKHRTGSQPDNRCKNTKLAVVEPTIDPQVDGTILYSVAHAKANGGSNPSCPTNDRYINRLGDRGEAMKRVDKKGQPGLSIKQRPQPVKKESIPLSPEQLDLLVKG